MHLPPHGSGQKLNLPPTQEVKSPDHAFLDTLASRRVSQLIKGTQDNSELGRWNTEKQGPQRMHSVAVAVGEAVPMQG